MDTSPPLPPPMLLLCYCSRRYHSLPHAQLPWPATPLPAHLPTLPRSNEVPLTVCWHCACITNWFNVAIIELCSLLEKEGPEWIFFKRLKISEKMRPTDQKAASSVTFSKSYYLWLAYLLQDASVAKRSGALRSKWAEWAVRANERSERPSGLLTRPRDVQ